MMDRVVTQFAEFHRTRPAYPSVYYAMMNATGGQGSHCGEAELQEAVTAHVEALFAARIPAMPPDVRRTKAAVSVEIVHSCITAAVLSPPEHQARMLEELKRVMTLYIEDAELEYAASIDG